MQNITVSNIKINLNSKGKFYLKIRTMSLLTEDYDFTELITNLYNNYTYNTSTPDSETGW